MLKRGVSKEIIRITTGHTDDEMIDSIYQHLTKEDIANKLHEGMRINQEEDLNEIPKPMLKKQKIEILETINRNEDNENYIKSIDEAKEVLCFLGVDAEDYVGVYDETKLFVMIGRQEAVLMEKLGIETTIKFKEIFNEFADLKERKKMLHELAQNLLG
jgi:hypothetical protein